MGECNISGGDDETAVADSCLMVAVAAVVGTHRLCGRAVDRTGGLGLRATV